MKRILLFIFPLLTCITSTAQQLNSIYNNNTFVSFEKYIYSGDSSFHTSIRPYFVPEMKLAFNYDSIRNSYDIERFRNKKVLNLIFNRDLFVLKKKDFGFIIDPQVDFEYGYDGKNNWSSWINTRGFIAEGYIGKNFAFSTSFYENQSKPALWINNYVSRRLTMPGQGGVKAFGSNAWDYSNASGYISWSPSQHFNFQLGQGKQFWGDGYRSLILSDFSLYHPYFMITTNIWKIKYVNLYSEFSHPDVTDYTNNNGSSVFAKKYSSMQYLSFVAGKRWEISLFEAVIWQVNDSTFHRGFELSYLNPVIFFRPLEFNLGSFDNDLMGINLRFTAFKGVILYGQFLIDDMRIKDFLAGNGEYRDKYGVQTGIKTYDLFGIKNLFLQAEYNTIRPYVYSHRSPVQNYSNAREPLAHPAGANTKEAVLIANYNFKRLYFNMKYVWEGFGLDSGKLNYGKNIFRDYTDYPHEYGNRTGQGLHTSMNQLDITASFLINPSYDLTLFAAMTFRHEENSTMNNRYSYFSFGLRTSLRNLYYDFY
jgi:hypothetical protein